MTTKEALTHELSAVQSAIEAQQQRMKFFADLRTQPALFYTLEALNNQHPEIIEQIRQVQQWYHLPVTNAMNYLQDIVMPLELNDLLRQRQQLESQLKLFETEKEQQSETGTEDPPAAEDRPTDSTGSEQVDPAASTAGIGAHATQQAEEEMEDAVLTTSTAPDRFLENDAVNAVSQGDDSREDGDGGNADTSGSNGPDAQEFIPAIIGAAPQPSDYLA